MNLLDICRFSTNIKKDGPNKLKNYKSVSVLSIV